MNELYYKKIIKILNLDSYDTEKIENLIKLFIDTDPEFSPTMFRLWVRNKYYLGAI